MFVELVILACLTGGPTCAEHHLLFDAREVSLRSCLVGAQPQVARWQEAHPVWRVARWSCGMIDPTRGEA